MFENSYKAPNSHRETEGKGKEFKLLNRIIESYTTSTSMILFTVSYSFSYLKGRNTIRGLVATCIKALREKGRGCHCRALKICMGYTWAWREAPVLKINANQGLLETDLRLNPS